MRKVAITLTLLAVRMSFTFGQTDPDSISMKKVKRSLMGIGQDWI
jgi:hypothetical protein